MSEPLGRVVATERKPNTPHEFHFWTALDSPVGIGTIVVVEGPEPVNGVIPRIYGVVSTNALRIYGIIRIGFKTIGNPKKIGSLI